jgi:hypothetical protein
VPQLVRKSTGLRSQTCRPQPCARANPDPVIKVRVLPHATRVHSWVHGCPLKGAALAVAADQGGHGRGKLACGNPTEHHHAKLDPITISNTRIRAALSLLTTVTHYPDCHLTFIKLVRTGWSFDEREGVAEVGWSRAEPT